MPPVPMLVFAILLSAAPTGEPATVTAARITAMAMIVAAVLAAVAAIVAAIIGRGGKR